MENGEKCLGYIVQNVHLAEKPDLIESGKKYQIVPSFSIKYKIDKPYPGDTSTQDFYELNKRDSEVYSNLEQKLNLFTQSFTNSIETKDLIQNDWFCGVRYKKIKKEFADNKNNLVIHTGEEKVYKNEKDFYKNFWINDIFSSENFKEYKKLEKKHDQVRSVAFISNFSTVVTEILAGSLTKDLNFLYLIGATMLGLTPLALGIKFQSKEGNYFNEMEKVPRLQGNKALEELCRVYDIKVPSQKP